MAAVRIDTEGGLPLKAVNLDVIPPEHRDKYVQLLDGSGYRLDYINQSDKMYGLYVNQIADGSLRVLPDGWTSETEKMNAAEQLVQQQKFREELRRLEDEQAAADRKRTDELLARVKARLDQAYDRRVESYKPPRAAND